MRVLVCATVSILMWALANLASIATATAQSFPFGAVGGNSVYDRDVISFSKRYAPGQIIVSFADRRLYYIARRGRAMSYPIAVPRAQDRWEGVERVSMKRVDPPWTPTPEMRRENPELPKYVPGGHPRNPLGVRAIYLGNTLYRIHGTDAPWTIGTNVSKGCIRMHNAHVVDLYRRVRIGAKVTATWQRFRPASNVPNGPINDLAGMLGFN
jgi:lipoprotein-anchoring transpeptidase ErfK/SrfK